VIGVPLSGRLSAAGGLDGILSIVQMPPGVPVACIGLDNARNAAIIAAQIIALLNDRSGASERTLGLAFRSRWVIHQGDTSSCIRRESGSS
jgi:phosphoribosylcarboxyaminoimidazole (NCAIR) mutase